MILSWNYLVVAILLLRLGCDYQNTNFLWRIILPQFLDVRTGHGSKAKLVHLELEYILLYSTSAKNKNLLNSSRNSGSKLTQKDLDPVVLLYGNIILCENEISTESSWR